MQYGLSLTSNLACYFRHNFCSALCCFLVFTV